MALEQRAEGLGVPASGLSPEPCVVVLGLTLQVFGSIDVVCPPGVDGSISTPQRVGEGGLVRRRDRPSTEADFVTVELHACVVVRRHDDGSHLGHDFDGDELLSRFGHREG